MLYKKAAVGETIHWVVATLVIIVILVASIFIASFLREKKFLGGEGSLEGNDLLVVKSLSGYLLTQDSGEIIFEQLVAENDSHNIKPILTGFKCDLAKSIFMNLYKENYQADSVWLGIYEITVSGFQEKRIGCFVKPPLDPVVIDPNIRKTKSPYAIEQIKLDGKRLLFVMLTN